MRLFRKRKPEPSEAARVLAEMACLSQRERIRARCRIMRDQMGLPPLEIFESRTERKRNG